MPGALQRNPLGSGGAARPERSRRVCHLRAILWPAGFACERAENPALAGLPVYCVRAAVRPIRGLTLPRERLSMPFHRTAAVAYHPRMHGPYTPEHGRVVELRSVGHNVRVRAEVLLRRMS